MPLADPLNRNCDRTAGLLFPARWMVGQLAKLTHYRQMRKIGDALPEKVLSPHEE